jgi:ubiquinone/menaquinone biosynthesis C-methylase UbiE
MSIAQIADHPRTLSAAEVDELDPYAFFAVLGKHVIHPGGRTATDQLIRKADFHPDHHVLDVGCGVGTTAIEISRRFGAAVTAIDIAPLMLERAVANVRAAALQDRVSVEPGDITAMQYSDDAFDRVVAEAVTMFVDRSRATRELVRVCKLGGRVLATEFFWRKPPTAEARHLFLGEVCPGMQFDTLDDWVRLYTAAGLSDVHVETGPFDMMTPRGFVHDEGFANGAAVMGRAMSRLSYARKMAWLVPRVARAVPYLGYILVSGTKLSGTQER